MAPTFSENPWLQGTFSSLLPKTFIRKDKRERTKATLASKGAGRRLWAWKGERRAARHP